jgi:hypothetical protein
MNTTNFVVNNAPSESMACVLRFMQLLNEKYPIDRSIGNFQANHSIVLDTDGTLIVSIWVWKQLDWRSYMVGLTPDDLARTPEGLLEEVSRTLTPELAKLIVPSINPRQ